MVCWDLDKSIFGKVQGNIILQKTPPETGGRLLKFVGLFDDQPFNLLTRFGTYFYQINPFR